jgi:deoxyadenosine/deoxycytidine kinase
MKIGITGSTCSGKTTFINYLMFNMNDLRKKVEIINERAMECPYPLNEKGGFRTQWWIQSHHIAKEYEASLRSEIVITDRTVFDGIPYLCIAPHTQKELDMTVKTATNWANLYPYDYVFYFAPIPVQGMNSYSIYFQKNIDEYLRTIISINIGKDKVVYIPYNNKIKRCEYAYKQLLEVIKK